MSVTKTNPVFKACITVPGTKLLPGDFVYGYVNDNGSMAVFKSPVIIISVIREGIEAVTALHLNSSMIYYLKSEDYVVLRCKSGL